MLLILLRFRHFRDASYADDVLHYYAAFRRFDTPRQLPPPRCFIFSYATLLFTLMATP